MTQPIKRLPLSPVSTPKSDEPVIPLVRTKKRAGVRAEILDALGLDQRALDEARAETRLRADTDPAEETKSANAELDDFIAEVRPRPRLRMSKTGRKPYVPPSPKELFPRAVEEADAESDQLDA